MRIVCLLLLSAVQAVGATYYVRTDGNNGNDGTANDAAHAWLTIGNAESTMIAGDTVQVQAGTYNERVAISGTSGNAGAWINYVANGQVICRGFDVMGVSYTRIIGFEITHVDGTYDNGIVLNSGTISHLDLVDNFIHEIKCTGTAIKTVNSGVAPTYITVRGNTIRYPGVIFGVLTNGGPSSAPNGIASCYVTPHHWLVEYNTLQKCGDVFISAMGTNSIVRNNYLHDFQNAYWNTTDSLHSDTFQCGSGGVQVGSRHHVYERNFSGDCIEPNSHWVLWRDTATYGDTNAMYRGNIVYNFGSSGLGVNAIDKVSTYNNTFYQTVQAAGSGAVINFLEDENDDPSINDLCANTIVDDQGGSTGYSIYIGATSTCDLKRNLGFNCPAHVSYVSTNDPLFLNPATHDFHLEVNSPARTNGTNVVWIISANASGTSFVVNDSQLLCDGWGMVDGDTITIGKGGTTTTITNITWGDNTVFVKDSVTWTNLMPVYWGTDTGPDIGALPYGSVDLTAATLTKAGNNYSVTTTGNARGVWFYVDGIPTTWVPTQPYVATIASGTVTAKAYALYAQANPVVDAELVQPKVSLTGNVSLGGNARIGQ